LTPEAAQQEIDAVRADFSHPFWSGERGDPAHDLAVQRMAKLYDVAAGVPLPRSPAAAAVQRQSEEPASLPFPLPARPDGWNVPLIRETHDAAVAMGVSAAEVQRYLTSEPLDTDPDATEAEFRREWGEAYPERLAAAQLAFDRLPRDARFAMHAHGLVNSPDVLRRLAELGTPMQQAARERDAMLLDPHDDLNHPERPEQAAALARYHELQAAIYGPGYASGLLSRQPATAAPPVPRQPAGPLQTPPAQAGPVSDLEAAEKAREKAENRAWVDEFVRTPSRLVVRDGRVYEVAE
jgi:hypothetical protein